MMMPSNNLAAFEDLMKYMRTNHGPGTTTGNKSASSSKKRAKPEPTVAVVAEEKTPAAAAAVCPFSNEFVEQCASPTGGVLTIPHQYFKSTVGLTALSNFSEVPGGFEVHGGVWPTAEHCYIATVFVAERDRHRFEVGGDLSTLDGLRFFFGEAELEKKKKFWDRTLNGKRGPMPGIVAKLAKYHPEKAGITLKPRDETPFMTDEDVMKTFEPIFDAKYAACEAFRDALDGVPENTLLVEFDRSAEKETKDGNAPRWTGMVRENEEGERRLYGKNLCGRMMMQMKRKNRA